MKRIAPVLLLLFLSPLVAEFLSGSLSFAEVGAIPVLILLYGAGSVLVREASRRTGRGWPTILLLGLAYALAEEGIGDQTLFNAGWHNLHLLDPGYIPQLGIGVNWTIYVLSIHVIWSIGVPIALAESLFPSLGTRPWLGRIGLALITLLYLAGLAAITLYSMKAEHFFASTAQIAGATAAILACVAAAFAWPRLRSKPAGTAPGPLTVGIATFVGLGAFTQLYGQGTNVLHWPWQVVSGGMMVLILLLISLASRLSRTAGWTQTHVFAMSACATLVYCWLGFSVEMTLHGNAMLPAHAALVIVMLGLLVLAGWNLRGPAPAER